jgi:hypothetical protein
MKVDEYNEKLIKIRYTDSVNWRMVQEWCYDNCTGNFYIGVDWDNWEPDRKNRCIEFELEKDAIMFALRWL